ncbi:MAG: AraC family transcriptional regulator, partial [Novosphingobium sp.]|nr:AraC family transcriptional regulator [Novosphingobium sp.]
MGETCKIDVRFFRPPPELEGCFTSFYRLEVEVAGGARVEDWLQPEWANIRFFAGDRPDAQVPGGDCLSGAAMTVSGPTSLAIRFRLGTTRAWGIGLFPLGWARFADVEASSMANRLFDGRSHPVFSRIAPLADTLFSVPPDDEAE